ncbi:MAG: polysaccharide biosynthesis tyrosine autokinase [Prevotella sp.]|nr:polysaccharide biosynthesis tyrosine autokinase [Prevotella sp.]
METTNNRNNTHTNELTFREFFGLCLEKKWWFAISLTLCLGVATIYLLRTPPTYTRLASVLIKEESNGASSLSSELGALSDMGLFTNSSNVYNELLSIESPDVMLSVVKRMELHKIYTVREGLKKKVLYGKELPLTINIDNLKDTEGASMTLEITPEKKITISKLKKNKQSYDGEFSGVLNSKFKTPIGDIHVLPTAYSQLTEAKTIKINIIPTYTAAEISTKRFKAAISNKEAAVIDLKYNDEIAQRAEDILNCIIRVYQENWIADKNQIANSTSQFINERLIAIEQELGNVDSDISSFKSKNLIPDIGASTKIYMENAQNADQQLVLLNSQLQMASYIKSYMNNNSNKNQTLPTGMIAEDKQLDGMIAQYNTLQLQRNSLVANSSESNPLVVDLDQQLSTMRQSISASINNHINQLKINISSVASNQSKNTGQIASSPTKAKQLLSVERQQKVKEALYIYLLQKREENELSQAFTAYNTRVITPPMGKLRPTSPVKSKVLMLATLLALLFPCFLIFMREKLSTTIRGKKELENLSAPFIGEIPIYKKSKSKGQNEHRILVKPKTRNIMNEAFRVIRTNIEFMLKGNDKKVILVTSINPSSGKTFITMNLSATFAIKDKKVVVIDLDIRRASLSEYVGNPQRGISDYLSDKSIDWHTLIAHNEDCTPLDVIPVGMIPPNPAELLANGRLRQLLEELRSEYDLIFIDSAPVEIVADTKIIADYADMSLFIIRNGLFERDLLPILETYYIEQKLKNMSIILNGTEIITGKYGFNRNGYGYGHGYGNYIQEI